MPGSEARPDVPEPHQVLVQREIEGGRALPHLERRESVYVQVGKLLLHGRADLQVRLAGEGGVDAALEADLDGAAVPRLPRPAHDLLDRHDIGLPAQVRGQLALREGAEAAAEVADVRVVDVARDDVADLVAADLSPKLVGRREHRAEVGATRFEE